MFIAVIYSIFSIFKVNYFNPIVQIFVKIVDPFTKVFLGVNKSISGLIVAIIFKFFGLLNYVSGYSYILLISISFFEVLIVFFKILFYFVIAGVVKSWVAPFLKMICGRSLRKFLIKFLTQLENLFQLSAA